MRWITLSDRYKKSITFNRDNITHVAESEVDDEHGNRLTVIYMNGNACEVVQQSYIEVLGMLKAGE
jgi:hypothetical protein